jgi:pimeloyl-ACP methyl ester carboxylesterase
MNRFAVAAAALAMLLTPIAAKADTTLHVDGALVQKSGSGPAVILIPGLGGGPFVYANVIPELSKRATVYAVTLPGYDGVAATQAPYLPEFEKSIVDLIAQEHLVRPLIVGHSLGGHLAVKLAEDVPGLGAVMAIDSVPLFPAPKPDETAQSRAAFASGFTTMMLSSPEDKYEAQVRVGDSFLTTGDANVAAVTDHALKSDRVTEVRSAAEMMLEDLGPKLSSITVPVVVLAASPNAGSSGDIASYYKQLYAGTPKLTVIPIAPSKHFIPLDQPEQFRAALDAFVAANAH